MALGLGLLVGGADGMLDRASNPLVIGSSQENALRRISGASPGLDTNSERAIP